METFQEQETKRKQKQKNRKDEKKSAAKNPKKESTTTVEYFDISDSSVDSYSTYGSDVEPDRDAPGTSAGGAKSSKMVARPDKAALTGWTNTPVPIGGGNENPCLKKQFVARQPQVPMKEHLAAKGMIAPAEKPVQQITATPGTSAVISDSAARGMIAPPERPILQTAPTPGISALIPDSGALHSPEKMRKLIPVTEGWPERDKTPSVRDIIGFQKTVPPSTTPSEIAKLAAHRFGWSEDEISVSSVRYIQGVVAGYHQAKRELLDELRGMLRDPPSTPENAVQRWAWISEWAQGQPRPETPDQFFED